jgi:hypothetical protein
MLTCILYFEHLAIYYAREVSYVHIADILTQTTNKQDIAIHAQLSFD